MTFHLGLTGSIGMGKSTTAKMFAEEGCDVWDADAAVHRLYAEGGAAVAKLSKVFPEAIEDNAVSRLRLKEILAKDPTALAKIEEIVHPLVGKDRQDFLKHAKSDIAVLDIPLLFEKRGETAMDAVVCVTVPPEVQRARVLERGTMTEAQFDAILAKQMPDEEKRRRSDFVILTDTVEHAREQVQNVVRNIRNRLANA